LSVTQLMKNKYLAWQGPSCNARALRHHEIVKMPERNGQLNKKKAFGGHSPYHKCEGVELPQLRIFWSLRPEGSKGANLTVKNRKEVRMVEGLK